ncbi:hypothetical protein N7523_000188 [Penicillium sp. IBT 18751x]|nr:hypothetical protein N7523_000188 [Penicillium sp. IBT 18751x]
MQAAQGQLEKKNEELADVNRDKSKKLSQMTNLYNILKARAMRTEMQTAASNTVSQTLNDLSSRNSTMLPPIQTHGQASPINTKARSRQGRALKTHPYPTGSDGVERLHRYQRSGTGSSRRAGEQNDSIPMAPHERNVWIGKRRKWYRTAILERDAYPFSSSRTNLELPASYPPSASTSTVLFTWLSPAS